MSHDQHSPDRRNAEERAEPEWSTLLRRRPASPSGEDWSAREQPRLVILTAALSEYRTVREFLTHVGTARSTSGAPYMVGDLAVTDGVWEVWVTCVGQGNIAAALQASQAVQELRPALIAFVGTAGSLKNDVELGDVVFATKVYGYESAKQTDDALLGRPVIEVTDRTLTQLAFRVAAEGAWRKRAPESDRRSRPTAHVAPIAAGDKLHTGNRSDLYQYLRESFDDAHAVEMEGLGFLSGARFWPTDTKAVLVRGVSDRLVDKRPDQDAVLQPAACRNAMAFLWELLEGCWPVRGAAGQQSHLSPGSGRAHLTNPPTFIPLARDSGVTVARRDDIPELDLVGEIVDGRYRLMREVGRGALNVVWEAEEFAFGGSLGRVALKLQPPKGDKRFVYFSREAVVMAGLDAPNILPYRSAGTQVGGRLDRWSFICTALAEFSLRDAVNEEPLWGSELLHMLRDVAAGLCHLHARRLIHGDVKPANILRLGERWVIGDFGLTQKTGAREPEGTVGYMAPERFNGVVTSKNDVYSFAVTAAVAASGNPRNENSTVDSTMVRIMNLLLANVPKPPPLWADRFPPAVADALRKALKHNPTARPGMKEILELLNSGDTDGPVSSPRSRARHAR
ncbi:hypothetical protein GCM10010251_69140 [Streptomyces aurantiogriseus]|uniref:Protein kinase domain-containing protein n=1 Tax=Streptomyces aurantiogriseus TaxID=66870 RepID=A0A918FJ77_9ACTN|nr:hypothetical protein GCM10010251_69140 [Streptomyces aurantiogriseus]